MPEIPDVLDRASRAVDLEQGDFERLLDRRERTQRNRRIRAGALGVVVALATAAILVSSVTSNQVPADPPTPVGAGEVLTVMDPFTRSARDLFAQDPDSPKVRTIVDADTLPERTEAITGAAWSNDHTWVAFRAGGLWVADTRGGAPQQITADQGWFPWAWSPTGDRLAVVDGSEMRLLDVATGREVDLGTVAGPEDSEGYPVHAVAWSPDGTRIAYDGGPGGGSVYSIDVESGEHSLIVRHPAGTREIEDIDWSPDGAHLAIWYVDASPVNHAKALYLAGADGSDVRLVDRMISSRWPVWHPGQSVGTAWSPDGSRLAYAALSGPEGPDRELQVWTVSVDGSAPSLIHSLCCRSDADAGVAWSPDGSPTIAVDTDGAGPDDHLVINADGTGDPRVIDELTYLSWRGGWYFCHCYG